MSISMYSASVPLAIRILNNLSTILGKAAAHCEARKIDEAAFLNARIFPDMFPLSRQVQIAGDMIKGGVSRLAGVEIPRFEDKEATFAELQARIAKTVDFLSTIQPEQVDGSEGKDIEITRSSGTVHYKGQAYLLEQVLPNFFFHVTTTYNLLRHGGVEIGKRDYLGN